MFCDYDELYYDNYMYCFEDYYDFVDGEPWLDESNSDTELPYSESYYDYEDAYLQGRECALETIFCDTDVLCCGEDNETSETYAAFASSIITYYFTRRGEKE